jgi:hypothetical protein
MLRACYTIAQTDHHAHADVQPYGTCDGLPDWERVHPVCTAGQRLHSLHYSSRLTHFCSLLARTISALTCPLFLVDIKLTCFL